jgi:hypothetical protein
MIQKRIGGFKMANYDRIKESAFLEKNFKISEKVKIVSDGTLKGTSVTIKGKVVENLASIEINLGKVLEIEEKENVSIEYYHPDQYFSTIKIPIDPLLLDIEIDNGTWRFEYKDKVKEVSFHGLIVAWTNLRLIVEMRSPFFGQIEIRDSLMERRIK